MRDSSQISGDLHNRAADDATLDVSWKRARKLVERNGPGHDTVEMPRPQVCRNPVPNREPHAPWNGGRSVNAQKTDGPKDEGHHCRLELGATRQSDARDVAPEIHGAREPRQHLATHIVDGPGELHTLERPRPEIDLLAPQNACRTQCLQVLRCC